MSKLIKFIKWIRKASSSAQPERPTIIHVPRAMHTMELKVAFPPCKRNAPRPVIRHCDEIVVVVINAQGATDNRGLVELLQKETGEDIARAFNPTTDDWEPEYVCGESFYTLHLFSTSNGSRFHDAVMLLMHSCVLFFSYDASSTESWDELVASCEDISSRCEDRVIPFRTIVVAMGEGCVSPEEAERFARQRSYRFFQYSPVTGQGLCRAFASFTEHAQGIRRRYATDPDGLQATIDASREVMQRLFG
ncbi:hypothetical protein BT67DRAFT_381637 [Trichocladium antarcticum]|uniref:Uncharacterized protein n=1 Tax=Trichocladium antarcticum TaxID=1450529 RepID=A0AAN6ZDH4_9PEZI|nr:hypothetical protein BT67DRAFT_381637 [Trichocladium antarcticum]